MTPERLYQLYVRLDEIEANIAKASLIIESTEDPFRQWYAGARQQYINKQAEEASKIHKEIKGLWKN